MAPLPIWGYTKKERKKEKAFYHLALQLYCDLSHCHWRQLQQKYISLRAFWLIHKVVIINELPEAVTYSSVPLSLIRKDIIGALCLQPSRFSLLCFLFLKCNIGRNSIYILWIGNILTCRLQGSDLRDKRLVTAVRMHILLNKINEHFWIPPTINRKFYFQLILFFNYSWCVHQ